MRTKKPLRLGDLLVSVGRITKEQLEDALKIQKVEHKKLGEILIEMGYITNQDMVEILEFQYGIPHLELEKIYIDPEAVNLLPEAFEKNNVVLPVKLNEGKLIVAMDDPLNIILINDMEIITGHVIDPRISGKEEILNTIGKFYSKRSAEEAVKDFNKEIELDEEALDDSLMFEINNAPVVRLVNTIILQAAQLRASDIHIEPALDDVRIRFRLDGDLKEIMRPAKQTHGAIVTRIKIMAKMDIAERRLPQDGRIETELGGKQLDLRVSTTPTIYGEKVVIRMVDRDSFLIDKTQLGFSEKDLRIFDDLTRSTNGIVLVTGPTGSGKSTTLYSFLKEINDDKKNIITIEDPVEYRMKGITQSQVNTTAGYDFANGLRSMLRQDPDVIMVGEIRDFETATIATRAAITGHLVLSTLHTNNAASTINRLMDMGIKPYLVASTLVAILSQVLVKKICPACREEYEATDLEKDLLGVDRGEEVILARGKGCQYCKETGYTGRIAVYEIMKFDRGSREMIINGNSAEDIKDYFIEKGMKTISGNCRKLVEQGATSLDEYIRISYSIEG